MRLWVQLAVGLAAVLGGAWLIGLWAVGVVLVLAGLGCTADVVLRNTDRWDRIDSGTHENVIDRFRRAP